MQAKGEEEVMGYLMFRVGSWLIRNAKKPCGCEWTNPSCCDEYMESIGVKAWYRLNAEEKLARNR